MPRTRELKPAFFQDEDLATLSRDHRLLFQALWTLADREGRLEDRPAWIKLYSFPFDADVAPADIDRMLTDLAAHSGRFIARYQVDGKRYLIVQNFKKHQHIHPKEAPSSFPPFPDNPVRAGELPGITGQATEVPVILPLPSEPSSTSEPARDPSRARSNPPANEPGKPSPINVVKLYLAIRGQVLGTGGVGISDVFAQPQQHEVEKAERWLSTMTPEEAKDIEPAFQLACRHVVDGSKGWTHESITKTGFLFGAIVTNWRDLREEIHGCAPKVSRKPAEQPRKSTPVREM